MASIPMGFCPRCGIKRKGHALRIPRYQTCPKCGVGFKITDNGKYLSFGFSPFTANELNIKSKEEIPETKGQVNRKHSKE